MAEYILCRNRYAFAVSETGAQVCDPTKKGTRCNDVEKRWEGDCLIFLFSVPFRFGRLWRDIPAFRVEVPARGISTDDALIFRYLT